MADLEHGVRIIRIVVTTEFVSVKPTPMAAAAAFHSGAHWRK
jgi:hypothetical protein